MLLLRWKQLKAFRHKPFVLHFTGYFGFADGVAHAFVAVGIAIAIEGKGAVYRIGFTVDPYGEETTGHFQSKLAGAAGSFEDPCFGNRTISGSGLCMRYGSEAKKETEAEEDFHDEMFSFQR